MRVVWFFLWRNMNIRCHRSSFWPLCVNGPCLHLKITAHQMVWASPRQPSRGGEAGVGFGAQTQLDRNGIVSSNKKLSDSSTSRNKHWVTAGGQKGDLRSGFQGGIVTFGLYSGVTPHRSTLIWFSPPPWPPPASCFIPPEHREILFPLSPPTVSFIRCTSMFKFLLSKRSKHPLQKAGLLFVDTDNV